LTTSADGAVPFTFKMADGNTEDAATHIATWDACRRIAGRPGFLYVADSKLATARNMAHIDREHGRFLSLLPRSRREDRQGRDWIAAGGAGWTLIASSPGRRKHDPPATWHAAAAPAPSAEGYQITWIRSPAKQATDAASRADRIARATASLDALAARLDAPRCQLKTTKAVTAAAGKIITATAAGRWVSCTVTSHDTVTRRQIGAGRPGPATRYAAITRTRCALTPATDTALAARDAASDGCFPLITNDHTLTPAQILAAYKHQPRIERRHATFKGILHAAPLELKNDTRIDALCFCLYTALLVHALTEREVRAAMTQAGLPELPLYHESRPCAAPSAARILEILAPLAVTTIYHDSNPVAVIPPALTPLQEQLITLLGVPLSAYHQQPGK
jgi:hypothetical protein